MFPFVPSLVLVLVLAAPALLTPSASRQLQVRGQRAPRDTRQDSIKVVISEGCVTQGDYALTQPVGLPGKEIDLTPGSPLILTHKIKLVPSGSGSGSCGCEVDFAALRERLERLEREVSSLREKCGGAEGGCCTSKESKGAGCSIKPEMGECPNECSDQGRCVDGKCVCFPGFSGPDCSQSNCPGNCNDSGRCVNGQCLCDPGFTGPDCSQRGCPDNCSKRGRCVDGKCVCDSGFTGADCSEDSCPGNCSNRGRCVNGECVCDDGFNGPDCSERTCPNDCFDRGRCVDGKCLCDSGFTGDDCSEKSCPGNCNNRGQCVDGKCVCDSGFNGADCSEKSCPGNCNNRGRCVNGQCVCNDGFTGADCSDKACPNNCSNRGKCVNGKCVCDVGSAGPDCSGKGCPGNCNNKGRCVKGKCVCRRGFTGADCSQCEDGMTGPNCDTAMSGVSQLTTRDITESSVTLLWTPPRVQYDTYYITFTSQKESDQQISVQVEGSLTTFTQTGLAAGQDYTASITGEIGGKRGAETSAEFMTLISGPSNLRVVKTTSTSAVVQWEQSQGEIDRYRLTVTPNDGAGKSQEMTVPAGQDSAHIQQLVAGRLYDIALVAEKGTSRSEPATTQATPGKTLPRVTMAALTMQVTLAPGQNVGDGDQEFKPSLEVQVFDQQRRREDGSEADSVKVRDSDGPNRHSTTSVTARTKPLVSRKMAMNGTKTKGAERPTLYRTPNGPFRFNTTRVVPGWRNVGQGSLRKPPVGQKKKEPILPKKPKPGVPTIEDRTIALHVRDPSVDASSTKRRDDKNPAIMSGTDSDTDRQSSSEEPSVAVDSKKQPDVGMAGQEYDTAPVSPEPTGTVQSQEKKCMNKVKVTHIRLPHQGRGSGCKGDGTVLVRKTAGSDQGSSEINDLKPSNSEEADCKWTQAIATILFLVIVLTNLRINITFIIIIFITFISYTVILLSAIIPIFFSITFTCSIFINSAIIITNIVNGITLFFTVPSIIIPFQRETETSPTSTNELSSSPSSSGLEDSSSVDVNASVRDTSGDKDGATKPSSSGVEQNQEKMPTERGRVPVRRLPPKSGYLRRQNFGPLQNKTRPNLRPLPPPSRPLNPASETRREHVFSTELPATLSFPVAKESYSAEGTGPKEGENEDRVVTSMSAMFNQTLRGSETLSTHRPPTKAIGSKGSYFRRPQLSDGRSQNKTRTNLRPPQHTHRGPMRKPFPARKLTGGITVGSQISHLEKDSTLEIPDGQSGGQDAPMPTQGVQIRQSGEQDTAKMDGQDTAVRPQTNKLEEGDSAPIQTTRSGEEETSTLDSHSDSDTHKDRVNTGKNTGATSRGRPTLKQTSSDSRHGAPRPVTLPKRQPPTPTRSMTAQNPTQIRHYNGGSKRREDKTQKQIAKRLFESKTDSIDSEPQTGSDVPSSIVTREPLDYVGVTNRTSNGFTLLSPGSSYEVSVISILGLDESDPIKDFVMTLPDPPTDLRAVNVTDNKALLLWRPALATVDKYAIIYGSGTDSELRITVSGNAAEQQLSGLEGSTTYTVTISSQLGSGESSAASTSFTTTGGSGRGGDGPSDLQANNVTPRTALLSWKPPLNPAGSYRLTYQTDGQGLKEVIVDASVTEYNLTKLQPGSKYTVQLQAEGGGSYTAAISTDFTTGTLRFPFPSDCSQELLNGIRTSGEMEIFPQGKLGTPMMVYCDMETDGGGWTVFQRRKDGSVDFFRGWKDYTKGFGSLSGEFWLGLESLYNLTAMTRMSLRVDLRDKGEAVFAKYSTFELLKRNYKLNVGGYSGTAGDSLSYHNQRVFSTKDRDPAPFITRCAMSYRGGWWYKNCHEANLNGVYGINVNHQGVIWTSWKGKESSIPFTEMKLRPAAFRPPTRG
ncbi:uncharacterized protein tnxbb [Sander vitreus]